VFFLFDALFEIHYRQNLTVDSQIIKKATATDHELSQLITKCNTLRRWIDKWREIQDIYMPSVTKYLAQSISPDDEDQFFEYPETIPLYLPSALLADVISTIPSKFIEIEKHLRISQADDSLSDLRRFLRITMGLWDYKHSHVGPSQRYGTHVYSTISSYREKVNQCSNRYRAARHALSVLDPGGTWVTRLHELRTTDIRPPVCDMDQVPRPKSKRRHATSGTTQKNPEASEGRQSLSWIWLAQPEITESEEGENEEVAQAEIDESKWWYCLY
jgi:hypothetical protein